MNAVLDFIVNEIFGQGAIFISLIALIGLLLQKKPVSEVIRGTFMTAIGYFVLNTGVSFVSGAVADVSTAFTTMMPQAVATKSVDIGAEYGTQIGIVMIIGFAINLIFARFTKWKTVFLTGHMLYWFPFVFIAAGVDAGLSGAKLIILAALFTAVYMIVAPNLMRPLVKKVTGTDSFSIAHPTTTLSLIAAGVAKVTGDPKKSTEDLKFPKGLNFLREVSITGSIVILLTYLVMSLLLKLNGYSPAEVLGYDRAFTYYFTKTINFGMGVTIMLLGVRMLIAEIVPAFQGIANKVVPGAIPALDCPVIFNMAPNALLIGFICALATSTVTILICTALNVFPTVVIPLAFTCFFEAGCAAIVANAYGGVRGCIIASIVNGIVMVLLVGFGAYFFNNTIQGWMLVYGGQDFSLWGILEGLIAKLIA
ncbi:MAG: PTS ascorbate transporter subunit IIC [Candidatus Faecousia sp.]|nr:PTS ascorbate transporter subunit IIC [Clostridiales bacterium]MDY6180321.1 PTS ascorbate transporter subunit IIC [Candidatus Faecousia sp.]